MGLIDFQIHLHNPLKVFFAGESISGQVVVNLNEPKKMEKIKVQLRGRGEVEWTETRNESRRNSRGSLHQEEVREHYHSSEHYLEQEAMVYPGPNLYPGIHVFPFTFTLPANLPSSYESNTGHVRYSLNADIVRAWKWNHKTKTHITVNSVLDLNHDPMAKQPSQARDYKNLCCLCCKSGPISAAIATNRSGYVPGELIGFSAEVDNQSDRTMKCSFLNLVEHTTFKARGKSKHNVRIVAEIRRSTIGPGCQDMWEDVRMKIPPLPPTDLGGHCGIISLSYSLNFHVEPSGMGFDLVVKVPVVIGTIPLMQFMPSLAPPPQEYLQTIPQPYPNQNPAMPYPNQAAAYPPPQSDPYAAPPPYPGNDIGSPSAPPSYNPSAPPQVGGFSAYPNLPPPTYADSVWGSSNVRHQEDDEHVKGDFDFVPRYVAYNTNY